MLKNRVTYNFNANTHVFQNCTMSGDTTNGSLMLTRLGSNTNPYVLSGNISEDITWNLNCYHTVDGIAHRGDNALQTAFSCLNDADTTSITNSIAWMDYTNAHIFSNAGAGGVLFEDNISFSEEPSSYANHYLPSEGTGDATIRRCITVGDNGVILRNGTGVVVTTERLTHICTAANTDALGIIESPGFSGQYTQRSCIEYSTSTEEALFNDLTATGLGATSYLDFNCIYSLALASRYNTTLSGKTLGDAGFGASDIREDPVFVDATANLKTWDVSLGGPGTIANVFSELLKMNGFDRTGAAATYDTNYNITDALAYFRARFIPTNTALKGTGYGGEDMGALAVSSGFQPAWAIKRSFMIGAR